MTSVQLVSQMPGLTLLAQLPSKHPYPTNQTDADPLTAQVHPQTTPTMNPPGLRSGKSLGRGPQIDCAASTADFNRFHFNGFTCYLTLFSKCFSSFPRGTCSLSVSCLYLALDEIYHPFWAAFPNNPTLRKRPVEEQETHRQIRDSHPL